MRPLEISETQDYLLKDGKPFFYLADTVWAAFANLSYSQWEAYLKFRKAQGFNALQISILPIVHDTSTSAENLNPFLGGEQGLWRFDHLNPAYFDKAERMVAMAAKAGFIPVLGVLWRCYIPDTEASKHGFIPSAMPLDAVTAYVKHISARFRPYNPVYFISGDTLWEVERETRFYAKSLEIVRQYSPESLVSMHMVPDAVLPESFAENIDFYMVQSGHGEEQKTPYTLAAKHSHYPTKRPILNAEPCYEGHGRGRTLTRFQAHDVRKATWQSLLSGAKVGIAYGAHGVWSCHFEGMGFMEPAWKFIPYNWDQALSLPGAWDAVLAKRIFKAYDLFDLEPTDLLVREDEAVAVAASPNRPKIAVYMPEAYDLELKMNLTGCQTLLFDLANRIPLAPKIETGPRSTVRMPGPLKDVLFLAWRQG